MYLRVDTRRVPPTVEMCEQEDLTAFKVVLVTSTHTWVKPDTLTNLAGRAEDDAWQDKLAEMIAYAERKGWTDEQGRVRAHVETTAGDGVA
ncbi:hypothetical protein [Streptomyces spongiae]|uniref:Uncharacterized protein n=1 Tax=Streptomyces spongiae TaxID=565072 RepID=A0A5N8X9U9_9ACTN|nr:hypothetical protein [Streptomyces spongiae]MPY55668.1 hypothetical protein [Streptomyces spongiae]